MTENEFLLQDRLQKIRSIPEEEKQCEYLWAPVYAEYRRIGYRLKDKIQPELF